MNDFLSGPDEHRIRPIAVEEKLPAPLSTAWTLFKPFKGAGPYKCECGAVSISQRCKILFLLFRGTKRVDRRNNKFLKLVTILDCDIRTGNQLLFDV